MNKTKLFDLIRTERARLDAAFAPLTQEQMMQPGVIGRWSVKDILAHVTFWEQNMLNRFKTGQRPPRPAHMSEAEFIDQLNEQNFLARRDKPLSEVLAEYDESHKQVLEYLQNLFDDDLTNPERWEWWRGEPVWHYIAGDTYEHYQEHSEPIRAWHEKIKSDHPAEAN